MNRRDFLFKSLTASALVGTMGTQNLFASGSKIDEAIKNVDPNAFVIISRNIDIIGNIEKRLT